MTKHTRILRTAIESDYGGIDLDMLGKIAAAEKRHESFSSYSSGWNTTRIEALEEAKLVAVRRDKACGMGDVDCAYATLTQAGHDALARGLEKRAS